MSRRCINRRFVYEPSLVTPIQTELEGALEKGADARFEMTNE